jgi:hypothetical protein
LIPRKAAPPRYRHILHKANRQMSRRLPKKKGRQAVIHIPFSEARVVMNKHIRKLELLHRITILATMNNYSPRLLRYMDAGD